MGYRGEAYTATELELDGTERRHRTLPDYKAPPERGVEIWVHDGQQGWRWRLDSYGEEDAACATRT